MGAGEVGLLLGVWYFLGGTVNFQSRLSFLLSMRTMAEGDLISVAHLRKARIAPCREHITPLGIIQHALLAPQDQPYHPCSALYHFQTHVWLEYEKCRVIFTVNAACNTYKTCSKQEG